MGVQTLELRMEGSLAIILLNRPKALNAINLMMVGELEQAVGQVRDDPGVRVVVITGAGDKAFAAGADITEFKTMSQIDAWMFVQRLQRLFLEIERLPKPVIAAVNGYALGGGCELMMACDIIYASDAVRIGQPEINLGIIPGAGGTQRLARLIGKQRAKELVLTGETIGAQEAWGLGLLNKVVPADHLMVEVRKLADKLAIKGPLAVRAAKEAIEDGYDMALERALAHEAQLFALCFATEDRAEGVNAFLEKRPPNFKGK
ncbi:MAG: enoyl-CoA hydratase/isomerase family protein [candidate division NC10 bacterium]|nr:enoyl-CoA hydratase/isomerase family protein [candidate division NC10 bacterium]MDE2484430.1 enoyl-CoA hydratase/isomerase family protein [candidate division NC10 bacterium]